MSDVPPKPKRARSIEVREIELEDLAGVYALGEKLFRADTWPALYRTWDEFEVVSFYGSDSDTCFVALEGDRLLGFVLGTVLEKRRSAWSYGWVVWLGVDPRKKRAGVATKLLDRLTDRFVELGCRMLLADTDPTNTPAVAFFVRNGFGSPREHIYLEKNVSKAPREEHRERDSSRPALRGGRPRGVTASRPRERERGARR